MKKGRLEAFSDGVLAIIITIMVLEFKVPHGNRLQDLLPLIPTILSYLISFVYVGIYWNNHHHMFQAVEKIDGSVLWSNLFLLFWLSLIPFATSWMGENNFSQWPVCLYGVILLMNSMAFSVLINRLLKIHDSGSKLAQAIGTDRKGKVSTLIYIAALAGVFFFPPLSLFLYCLVAVIWFIPDRRIERLYRNEPDQA